MQGLWKRLTTLSLFNIKLYLREASLRCSAEVKAHLLCRDSAVCV